MKTVICSHNIVNAVDFNQDPTSIFDLPRKCVKKGERLSIVHDNDRPFDAKQIVDGDKVTYEKNGDAVMMCCLVSFAHSHHITKEDYTEEFYLRGVADYSANGCIKGFKVLNESNGDVLWFSEYDWANLCFCQYFGAQRTW